MSNAHSRNVKEGDNKFLDPSLAPPDPPQNVFPWVLHRASTKFYGETAEYIL